MNYQEAFSTINEKGLMRSPKGFPSDNVSPKVKVKKPWILQYLQAIHDQGDRGESCRYYHLNKDHLQVYRSYAQGRQDMEQYKPKLNIRKQRGRQQQSYRNLDFEILGVGKKFKNALKGKIRKRKLFKNIEAIDDLAKQQSRMIKASYQEFIINKEFIKYMQENHGYQGSSPLEHGEPNPESMTDIELNMTLFPKQRYILEMYDIVDLVNTVNDRAQIEDELLDDLVETGIQIAKIETTNDGFEKVRRCIPENCISNNHQFKDGRDIYYFGEYREITIQQLKEEAQDAFTEKEYQDIAEKATGNRYSINNNYYSATGTYPYDSDKILILDAEMISSDKITYLIKRDEFGNITKTLTKNFGFPSNPDGTPRKDEDYANENPQNEIVRKRINNVYKGKLIINTDYVYHNGLGTDMERVINQLEEVRLSYKVYNLFDSPFRLAKPILDEIQINWLKFQHHVAQSRVGGLSIEMSAMENLKLGPNGEKIKPRQALELYFETGLLFWRAKGTRQQGASGVKWKPVEELNNQMNSGAEFHFGMVLQQISLLRDILGLNEVTDASTPNPETGKAVSEFMVQGTEDVLDELYEARRIHLEMVDKRILYMIPIALKNNKHPGLINALGYSTYNYIVNNSEIGMHEFSIKYELGADDQKRARFQAYIQSQLKSNGGMFDVDEIIEYENDDNPMRALQRLRLAKRKKEAMVMEQQAAADEANTTRQIESNKSAAIEKRKELEFEHTLKIKEHDFKIKGDIMLDRQQTLNKAILIKLEKGLQLTAEEEQHMQKMAQIDKTKEWDLKIKATQNRTKQKNTIP